MRKTARSMRMNPGWVLLVLLFLVGMAGCGSKSGQLPTAPVTGRVTYQGKPVPRGEITFVPTASQPGVRNAYGTLDEQGRYRLTTYREGDGAVLGTHQVMIVAREELPADVGKQMTPDGILVPGKQAKSLIPERYSDPATSGLTAEVKDGRNEFNFELKD